MLPFSKRANGLFQIPMNIDTSIGKYLLKFIGKNHLFIIPLIEFGGVAYNTPRFSDRHNYGGMTRNRYICKKEENQNGKTI